MIRWIQTWCLYQVMFGVFSVCVFVVFPLDLPSSRPSLPSSSASAVIWFPLPSSKLFVFLSLPVRPSSPLLSVIGETSRRRCWQTTRPEAEMIARGAAAMLPRSSWAVRNSYHAGCHYLLKLPLSFFPYFLSLPRVHAAGIYIGGWL